jgi:hypothetical protein
MKEIKTAQEETILGIVNEIFEKSELICPIEDDVSKNEKLVGQLTDYEKAVFLASRSIGNVNFYLIEKGVKRKKYSEKNTLDVLEKASMNNIVYSALTSIFWASVKSRLGHFSSRPGFYLGVRKDWNVVMGEVQPPNIRIFY